jgi:hypothetical protein
VFRTSQAFGGADWQLRPGEAPPEWARDLLYYNPTVHEATVELGALKLVDLDGVEVSESFELGPMSGRILLATRKVWVAGGAGLHAVKGRFSIPVWSVGSMPARISSVELTSGSEAFSIDASSCADVLLEPSQRCEVVVEVSGSAEGALVVHSNDPSRPELVVPLGAEEN